MTTYSPVLAINEIAQNQNNKYITHNDAVSFLEAAANKTLVKSTGIGTDWNITEAEFTRYMIFKPSGASGAFTVDLPALTNVTIAERVFMVWNADTTYAATVRGPTPTANVVVLQPGEIAFCNRNGNDIYALMVGAAGSVVKPYDLALFVPGKPDDGATVLTFTAVRAFSLADDFAGSDATVGTNPTSTAAFDIKKNGSSIGSLSISTGGAPTFATTGGAVSMAAGDTLEIVAPTPQDTTLEDVSITFLGSR